MDHAILTRGLERQFGARLAVADVELSVPRACCFGLLGPNGAGKTTLIRMLLGLIAPTGGEAYVLGHRMPAQRRAALSRVGSLVEEPRFHQHLTGRENLVVHAAAREPAAAGRISAALERAGLAQRADERVGGYSLGMRQRLAIARCLLADPLLLILDEPMNGLDPAGVLELRALLASLVDEGRTVLLSSHQLDEIERTCDTVAILDAGRIVTQGPIAGIAGPEPLLEIGCDDARRALAALAGLPAVGTTEWLGDTAVRVTLAASSDASAVVRTLVLAGIGVDRVEPARHSLEERFLSLTTSLGDS
jgi:ABC-2 type transport system ATP-binding protein